jgi:hypothetical protein
MPKPNPNIYREKPGASPPPPSDGIAGEVSFGLARGERFSLRYCREVREEKGEMSALLHQLFFLGCLFLSCITFIELFFGLFICTTFHIKIHLLKQLGKKTLFLVSLNQNSPVFELAVLTLKNSKWPNRAENRFGNLEASCWIRPMIYVGRISHMKDKE